MTLRLFIQITCIAIFALSCNANKSQDDIIETRTDLTSVEIINYFPNNYFSINTGYVKQSLGKMDFETYSKINEEFSSADTNNNELYFDSLGYELIKKIDNLNYFNQKQFTSLINSNFTKTKIPEIYLTEIDLMFIGIVTSNENTLLVTLEVPIDYNLKWSVVKIWTYDSTINRLQIHSILKANSNSFEYLGIENHNINLIDGDFVYRIVLDDDYRFEKNMEIFVSMDTYDSPK